MFYIKYKNFSHFRPVPPSVRDTYEKELQGLESVLKKPKAGALID